MTVGTINEETILVADIRTEAATFRRKAASDENVPCVIKDYGEANDSYFSQDSSDRLKNDTPVRQLILYPEDGEGGLSDTPFDVALSPIRTAAGWQNAPSDAKEFTLLLSGGLLRRPALILKGDSGTYDHIAIYASKKDLQPLIIAEKDIFTSNYMDKAIKGDQTFFTNRNLRLLEIAEDGSHLKLWI